MSKYKDLIKSLESLDISTSDSDIYQKICEVKREDIAENDLDFFNAEHMGFAFQENYNWETCNHECWGTYLGPFMTLYNKKNYNGPYINPDVSYYAGPYISKGDILLLPNFSDITENVVDYWLNRFNSTNNSALKVRYAILTLDFYNMIKKKQPNINVAQTLIDEIIKIISIRKKYDINDIPKLKHAFKVAVSINDKDRIKFLKGVIIHYETTLVNEDSKIGAWSISYKLFIEDKKLSKKASLSTTEKMELVSRIETRFQNIYSNFPSRPVGINLIKQIVIMLADYYHRAGNKEKVRDYLLKLQEHSISQSKLGSPLQAHHWLSEMVEVMDKYNFQENRQGILGHIQDISKNVHKDMKTFSIQNPVDDKKLNAYIDKCLSGDLERSLIALANSLVTSKKSLELTVSDLANEHAFTYLSGMSIYDIQNDGRKVAKIKPFNEYEFGHIIRHLVLNLSMSAPIIILHLEKLLEMHTPSSEDIARIMQKSVLFESDKSDILLSGLSSFIQNNYINCIHVLVPYLENTIRNILKQNNIPTIKILSNGSQNLKQMSALLKEPVVISTLGEDVVLFFDAVFNESGGINLRNNVCHGISKIDDFNIFNATLVICALLLVSQSSLQ